MFMQEMQETSAIFINQMQNFHAFKAKLFSSMQTTTFSTVCHFVLKYVELKVNIQTNTKQYTSIHPFWSVDKCVMFRNDLQYCVSLVNPSPEASSSGRVTGTYCVPFCQTLPIGHDSPIVHIKYLNISIVINLNILHILYVYKFHTIFVLTKFWIHRMYVGM